jgi:hypothetical protein
MQLQEGILMVQNKAKDGVDKSFVNAINTINEKDIFTYRFSDISNDRFFAGC